MINVNLLPRSLRRRRESGLWRLGAVAVMVTVGLGLGLWQWQAHRDKAQLEQQRQQLQTEVNLLQQDIQLDRQLRLQKVELQKALAVESNLRKLFVPWSDKLAQILQQIPRSPAGLAVSLSRLEAHHVSETDPNPAFDQKKVDYTFTVIGVAPTQANLVQFVQAFESSAGFAINFQRAERDTQSGFYGFSAIVAITESEERNAQTDAP